MLKKDKVKFIIKKLDEFYPEVNPPLDHKNNYTLLIAVLLSANSTDKSVNKVTPHLFKKADSPKKMLKLSYEDLYKIISFPHALDHQIILKKILWKSCEKFFFGGGNIF